MNEPKLLRKETITDKLIKKQKKYFIIAIMCVVTLLISSSYALLTNFDKTDEVITFQTGNLNMTVNNTAGTINLNGNLPENDTDGLKNATPITLTFTNTGTINIMKYDVKLVSDETKTSTLDEDYIKYAISTDGTNYSKPSILTSNENIIYTDYILDVNASTTIYLKVWIDESAGNNALNKEYYGSIKVDLYQKAELPYSSEKLKKRIAENTTDTCNPIIEEDGIIYLSGTNECVNFNYVWYSGKLWRVTAIYPDGTMKMVTEDNITSIDYNKSSSLEFYVDETTNSYVYQWLNQDFLPTLYNYQKIIVTDAKWNATTTTENSNAEKLEENNMKTSTVGLLNSYEYYLSYQNASSYSTGYLNIGYDWWLLNPYYSPRDAVSSNDNPIYATPLSVNVRPIVATFSGVWVVNELGKSLVIEPSSTAGVRPSIILKLRNEFASGTGIKTDPYIIKGDKEEIVPNTTLLNTRSSGEYVNFDGETYRIVEVENGITKINKVDYLRDENDVALTKYFASSFKYGLDTNTQDNNYWDYYLNTTWYQNISSTYKNMMVEGLYYLNSAQWGYKYSICEDDSSTVTTKDCEKTTITWTGYVGLPRLGEIFSSQLRSGSSSESMWLITPYYTSEINIVSSTANLSHYEFGTNKHAVRPSIHLKSDVIITGGTGLEGEPFEIEFLGSTGEEEAEGQ